MALVRAVCTACGSNLEVDDKKEAAICPYCGAAYVVEKARDIYLTNNAKIESIHADTVNIGKNEEDRLYDSAEALIKLGKSKDALSTFQKMTNSYPYDYRGWWGLAKAESNGLNTMIPEKSMVSVLEHMESAIKVAPDDIAEELKGKANRYKDSCIETLKSRMNELPKMKAKFNTLCKPPKQSRMLALAGIITIILAVAVFVIGITAEGSNPTLCKALMFVSVALLIISIVLGFSSTKANNKNTREKDALEVEINKLNKTDEVLNDVSRIVF